MSSSLLCAVLSPAQPRAAGQSSSLRAMAAVTAWQAAAAAPGAQAQNSASNYAKGKVQQSRTGLSGGLDCEILLEDKRRTARHQNIASKLGKVIQIIPVVKREAH